MSRRDTLHPRVGSVGVPALLALVATGLAGCSGPSPSLTEHRNVAVTPAAPVQSLVILGDPFAVRPIPDPEQGVPAGIVVAPAAWQFRSSVVWNYDHFSSPVAISLSAESPANDEAYFAYPAIEYFDLRPDAGFFRSGQEYGGLVFGHPSPPVDTLVKTIRRVRGRSSHLAFVGRKDLTDLPAALHLPPASNQQGLGVKVSYEVDGRPVEEEFYAVFYSVDIPYDGPGGRTWEVHWGLAGLHSFRARQGTLDRRRPVFAAISRSFRSNPAWQRKLKAVNTYLTNQFNSQLRAGYDSIAAAGRMSREISASNQANIAAIDRQLEASSAETASRGVRTPAERFDDYIRGADTVDDPYYGRSQHPSIQSFHWTDGYGNYRHTDDASDPNRTEVGHWLQLKAIH